MPNDILNVGPSGRMKCIIPTQISDDPKYGRLDVVTRMWKPFRIVAVSWANFVLLLDHIY